VNYDLGMGIVHNRRETPSWVWIAAIWSGLGLFAASQTVFAMRAEGMHHAWLRLFATTLLSWLPWALSTVPVLKLSHKFPPLTLKRPATWLIHLGACLTIGVIYAIWTAWLDTLFNPFVNPIPMPFHLLWLDKFYNGMLSSVVLYATILTVSYGLDSRARLAKQQIETARLSEQLSNAQFDALRRQIEPHFLFNTLNAVAGLVREGRNDSAVSMIAGLSDFLRRTLDASTRQQVPLQEEMDFTRKYLEIQKVRFVDRLQLSVDVPAELYSAQVPSLILQPMVENAVKHGIAKRVQGGAIRITASRSDQVLTLSVCNDGPSLPPNWTSARPGIGISNVRTRLESLYGDAFELTMRNHNTGGVEVSVSLPFVVFVRPAEA